MNHVLRQESSAFGKSNATLLLNILSYLEPKNPSFSLCLKEFKEKPVQLMLFNIRTKEDYSASLSGARIPTLSA